MNTYNISEQLRQEMINWLADCQWGNMEAEDFEYLSNDELTMGIINHYNGGLQQFIKDGE